ncbi:MAG TPA: ferredoxin family protein [Candidatus Mailhella excrementigallinarum]|nr:MAG: ferredoxin [Desulfovibrionaceae bacterium]PWL60180.1 MAG: ferredoxin [Desulfovibrionaceae bacterium]HIV67182.1 ferredoxin family protein [Candidatus Mailhella excrementigallinarum]
MPPVIHADLCKKCCRCAEACQSDVFYGSIPGTVPAVTYPDECWHCNACVMECPAGAVELRIPMNLEPMYQERR